jgi:hypothetical protein
MSRGPGRWQRLVLDLVNQAGEEPVVLTWRVEEALDRSLTAAEFSAVNRAAWALADSGKVALWRGWVRTERASRTTMLMAGAMTTPWPRPYQAGSRYRGRSRRGDGRLTVEAERNLQVQRLPVLARLAYPPPTCASRNTGACPVAETLRRGGR